MTLGELIARLESLDPERVFEDGFTYPHSYRGYYEQLAFEPTKSVTVGSMLHEAREALGETYQGYKGGNYTMREDTPVWIAEYGCSTDDTGMLTEAFFMRQDLKDLTNSAPVVVILTPSLAEVIGQGIRDAGKSGETIRLWIDPQDGGVKVKQGNRVWTPAYGVIE